MRKSDDELSDWEIQQIAIESAFHQADKLDRPIGVLLECYQNYQEHNPNADAIANDSEALKWLDDYWEYVCMVENGRQCSMKELDGFIGMADYITNPYIAGQVIEYLQYDDDKVDEETQNLIDRLKQIASRYNGVSKMKKSAVRKDSQDAEAMERFIMANEIYFRDLVRNNPFYMVEDYVDSQITWYNYELDMTPEEELDQDIIDIREVMGGLPIYNKDAGAIARAIWNKWKGKDASAKKSTPSIHDMIAQTRANNNSLTKSRVDLSCGIKKYHLEEDRYNNSSYPEWRATDEIWYVMWEEGSRYDHSGGEPIYPGSLETGFRTLEEACVYTVEYLEKNRKNGITADDLSVVEINSTIYNSEDYYDKFTDPEAYEGKWYDYPEVKRIARRV